MHITWKQIHVKFIPSGTVEYGQLNMAVYSNIDVALHTFSMEQVHTAVSYNPIRISIYWPFNLKAILKGKASLVCLLHELCNDFFHTFLTLTCPSAYHDVLQYINISQYIRFNVSIQCRCSSKSSHPQILDMSTSKLSDHLLSKLEYACALYVDCMCKH